MGRGSFLGLCDIHYVRQRRLAGMASLGPGKVVMDILRIGGRENPRCLCVVCQITCPGKK